MIQSQYGFNPGDLSQFSRPTNSDKMFVRTDFNLSAKNQLTARVNYVNGLTVRRHARRRRSTCCRTGFTASRTRSCRQSAS